MGEKKSVGTCGGCRFGRDFGDGLRCIKDPPSVNQETGEAVWPCVRITDTCREFRPAGDGRDLVVDRRLRGMIPIYRDKEGDYCKIPLTRGHYAKVDPEDYCWLSQFRWHYVRTGRTFYAVRSDYSGGRGRKNWIRDSGRVRTGSGKSLRFSDGEFENPELQVIHLTQFLVGDYIRRHTHVRVGEPRAKTDGDHNAPAQGGDCRDGGVAKPNEGGTSLDLTG